MQGDKVSVISTGMNFRRQNTGDTPRIKDTGHQETLNIGRLPCVMVS